MRKRREDDLLHSPISKEVSLLIEELEQFNKDNYIKYLNKKDDDDLDACCVTV